MRYSLLLVCCCGALVARAEVTPGHDTIATIVDTDRKFDSLQAAIDAAPAGSTIELGTGRFDERLRITKSITLVGEGTDATILGPTEETQLARSNRLEELFSRLDAIMRSIEQSRPRRELTSDETEEVRNGYAQGKLLDEQLRAPVITVEGNTNVELRSLRVTMPLTPREGSGLPVRAAIQVKDAKLSIRDVAIVGCMAEGIDVTGDAKLTVDDCLVAACWGTGVSASHPNTAKVHIKNSDVRNNYHYNIGLGIESCVIEDCRISGTAWSGISTGAKWVRIERNIFFHNNRAIYAAGESGVVRGNLIYDNVSGASCWYRGKPLYESNIFYNNKKGGIFVAGPAEPLIRKNLFVAGERGLSYRPAKTVKQDYPVADRFRLEQNVFWEMENPLSITRSTEDDARPEHLDLPEGNEIVDPRIDIPEGTLTLGNQELAKRLGIDAMHGMSLKSHWPITPEEAAMIPDDGLLDANLWKKRPKRILPHPG